MQNPKMENFNSNCLFFGMNLIKLELYHFRMFHIVFICSLFSFFSLSLSIVSSLFHLIWNNNRVCVNINSWNFFFALHTKHFIKISSKLFEIRARTHIHKTNSMFIQPLQTKYQRSTYKSALTISFPCFLHFAEIHIILINCAVKMSPFHRRYSIILRPTQMPFCVFYSIYFSNLIW